MPRLVPRESEDNLELSEKRSSPPIAFLGAIMFNRIIAAAFVVAGIVVQTPAMTAQAQDAAANASVSTTTIAVDPEAAAKKNWRETIGEQSASGQGKGCFRASYPNYFWEAVPCSTAGKPSSHPTPNRVPDDAPGPQEGGTTGEYVAPTQNGLITHVAGTFYRVSGVTSEKNVDTNGDTTGSNDYGLQINTNWSLPANTSNSTLLPTATPAACQGHPGCQIWQQFIYTSDFNGDSGPAGSHSELFMQYWLFNWLEYSDSDSASNSYAKVNCQYGWNKVKGEHNYINCYRNGHIQSVPVVIPVSDLGEVKLSSSVQPGGNDELYLSYGADAWAVIESDGFDPDHPNEDGISIASIWQGVEFNIVGNTGGSQAVFNQGSVLGVTVNILDGSGLPPLCLIDSDPRVGYVGTTGETNNLTLGPCRSTVANGYTAIQFLEGTPQALLQAILQQTGYAATAQGSAVVRVSALDNP
jgi:hypothetical protein